MNGILRRGINTIATLAIICLCSTAQSALIPAVATNVDLSVIASNTPTYTQILLMPGTYNVTNAIRLKEGQSLIGQGYGNTFLRFWGYTIDSSQAVGDYWVAILLNTNAYIADLDVRCMISSNSVFQACIGFPANAGAQGGTNFLVERVSMHGDTDNFYQDNGSVWSGSLVDCMFDSKWDTCVFIIRENSLVNIINPSIWAVGPNVSKPASEACSFRFSASGSSTNRVINIRGAKVECSGEFLVGTASVNFYDSYFVQHGTGTGAGQFQQDGAAINFYGCGVNYANLFTHSGQAGSKMTIYDASPQNSGAEEAGFGDPLAGAVYWNTNLNSLRLFDGLGWASVEQRANTNQLLLTGDGTAAYNGVYTWKSGGIGTAFFSYTNYSGKFLVGSTNSQADAPLAISDTESISNGAEHVINGTPNIERGWDTAAIRVRWIQGPPSDFYVDTDRSYGVTNGSFICRSPKAITKSSATTLFNFTIATNRTVSMRIFATVRCNNGTDYQVLSDELIVNAVSKNGVITTGVSSVTPTANAPSTGTITDTWTAVANANLSVDVKINAVPSLTPGTLVCNWRVDVDSDSTVVITP